MKNFLTDQSVVFQFHQGYLFYYFEADGSESVPIYMFAEGDVGPTQGASDFRDYLLSELESMEEVQRQSYANGGYFVTILENGVIRHTFPAKDKGIVPLDMPDQFI